MKEHYMTTKGEYQRNGRHRWIKIMVSGEIFNTVFGIREEPIPNDDVLNEVVDTGWRITHIPTGHLLVGTYFTTREDAIQFARITRRMFGDLLETDDIAVLKRIKNDKPEYRQFYDLKERMNNATGTFSFEEAVNL